VRCSDVLAVTRIGFVVGMRDDAPRTLAEHIKQRLSHLCPFAVASRRTVAATRSNIALTPAGIPVRSRRRPQAGRHRPGADTGRHGRRRGDHSRGRPTVRTVRQSLAHSWRSARPSAGCQRSSQPRAPFARATPTSVTPSRPAGDRQVLRPCVENP
jgi:hypothetical protein